MPLTDPPFGGWCLGFRVFDIIAVLVLVGATVEAVGISALPGSLALLWMLAQHDDKLAAC